MDTEEQEVLIRQSLATAAKVRQHLEALIEDEDDRGWTAAVFALPGDLGPIAEALVHMAIAHARTRGMACVCRQRSDAEGVTLVLAVAPLDSSELPRRRRPLVAARAWLDAIFRQHAMIRVRRATEGARPAQDN